MQVKAFQLHKKGAVTYDKIEDSYAINNEDHIVVVSDGATQGYYSGLWARILTNEFANRPAFGINDFMGSFLQNCLNRFNAALDQRPAPADRAMAILDRDKRKEGAYATLLAIQISSDNRCKVIACGDSNLFVYENPAKKLIRAFPFGDVESLNGCHCFIDTRDIEQGKLDSSKILSAEWQLAPDSQVYLITDALSRHLLKQPLKITALDACRDFSDFHSFAERSWQNGELESDDLSMVKISIDNIPEMSVQTFLPFLDFAFAATPHDNPIPEGKQFTALLANMQQEIGRLKSSLQQPGRMIKPMLAVAMLTAVASSFGVIKLAGINSDMRKNIESLGRRIGEVEVKVKAPPTPVVVIDTFVKKKAKPQLPEKNDTSQFSKEPAGSSVAQTPSTEKINQGTAHPRGKNSTKNHPPKKDERAKTAHQSTQARQDTINKPSLKTQSKGITVHQSTKQ